MVKVDGISRSFKLTKNNNVQALKDVSFEINKSSLTGLVGPSGSGKSTLLNILGGLDREYEGKIFVDGKEIKEYDPNFYRRNIVQTIFQQFYLVPTLSVLENTLLPIKFGEQFSGKEKLDRAHYIIDRVGLSNRIDHKPKELSGGQAQRVAIARALMPNPDLILADEPTGNLDTKTGDEIMQLLLDINRKDKTTIVVITHDTTILDDIKNKIYLKDGIIVNKT